jgi:translation initiation factor 2B subunit (eIF-2B alpha/beta/delta family)
VLHNKKSPNTLLKEISKDKFHGADFLSNKALEAMVAVADSSYAKSTENLHDLMNDYTKKLIEIRPSMAPIASKLGLLFSKLDFNQSVETLRIQVKNEVSKIIKDTEEIKQRISEHARAIMGEPQTVFTHSSSSTVLKVITGLSTTNVFCTESRPQLEGRNMAARAWRSWSYSCNSNSCPRTMC